MKYLPDTNIFILGLKNHSPESDILKFSAHKMALSVVVIAEFYPKASSQDLKIFDVISGKLPILNIDFEIAKQAGLYRKSQFQKKRKSYLNDCFLAAQAKLNNLTIVTNNKSDFQFKDIKVVSPKELL